MKKRYIALAVLAVIIIIVAVLYSWAQRRATAEITTRLRKAASSVIANPENLQVTNTPIEITGKDTVRIEKLQVSGEGLKLPGSMSVQSGKVTVHDVEANLKTKKLSHVGKAELDVTITDTDFTNMVHQLPEQTIDEIRIPVSTVTAKFTPDGAIITGEMITKYDVRLTYSLKGRFYPVSDDRLALFRISEVTIPGAPGLAEAAMRNNGEGIPLREVMHDFTGTVTDIVHGDGFITLRGTVDGAKLMR